MMSDYREKAFEVAIEHALLSGGYIKTMPENFDRVRAIDRDVFIDLVKETQRETWGEREKIYGIETTIGRPREYRQALITSAVTGQLDVRDDV